MSSPKESKEQKKPSSSEQQPLGQNNRPQNTPGAQERTAQNDSNVTQHEKSEDGDDNVMRSQGGNQVKTGKNKTNSTGTRGDAETETKGSGGDNVKGQGGGGDPKNEKKVSQTEKGQVSGASTTGGGTSASIFLTRKRGRQGDPIHVGSSSGNGSKGKVEVPSCAICKKTFPSWRGVFGHMRAHPRPTFCVFPPPKSTPEGSSEKKNNNNNKVDKTLEEQLAPTLLSLACQTLQTVSQDSNASDSTGVASSSRRRGLDIDLNEPRTNVLLDTPPPQKEEDDDGGDHQN